MRILMVDDDSKLANLVVAHLIGAGHEVLLQSSAQICTTRMEQFRPNVALLELLLKNGSGFEICRIIRRNTTLYRTSILGMTTMQDMPERNHALRQGVDDYLVKPFRITEMNEKLERMFRLSAAANEVDLKSGLPGVENFKRVVAHQIALRNRASLCCFEIHGILEWKELHGPEAYCSTISEAAQIFKHVARIHGLDISALGYLGAGYIGAIVPEDKERSFCFDMTGSFLNAMPTEQRPRLKLWIRVVRPGRDAGASLMDTMAQLQEMIRGVPLSQEHEYFSDRRHSVAF